MSQDDDKHLDEALEALEAERLESAAPPFTGAMHARLMARLGEHRSLQQPSAIAGWLAKVRGLLEAAFEPVSWLDLETGALAPSTASSEAMTIKVAPTEDEEFFEQVELRIELALVDGEDQLSLELIRPSWAKESWAVTLVGAPGDGEALIEARLVFHDLTEPTMVLGQGELGFPPERLACINLTRA